MDQVFVLNSFLLVCLFAFQGDCTIFRIGKMREESSSSSSVRHCNYAENCGDNNSKEIISTELGEPRKKQDTMSRIIPMMVMPFLVQTALLPLTLMGMKFMLMNGMFLGKLAIFLSAVNLLKHWTESPGGLYSHNINLNKEHPHGHGRSYYPHEFNDNNTNKWRKRRKRRRRWI